MKITKTTIFIMTAWAVLVGNLPGSALCSDALFEDRQEVFLEEIPDWQARLELARLLSYTKRYQESVLQYKKILNEKPGLAEARLELARVLYWKGDLNEAEQVFSSVPKAQLSDEAKLEMADIYVARKKYEPAVKIYADHLSSKPLDHAVRLKLAQVLSWTGDYEASAKEFRIILKKRPEDIQVRRKYAQVLIWSEQFDQAITELEKTLAE